jgi:hypothetical protein
MKKLMVLFVASLVCVVCLELNATQVFAGNGDLIVNGNLGVGGTVPQATVDVNGDIQVGGFGRFKGWSTGVAGWTGQGVEIGVTSGNGYLFDFDRTTNTAGVLSLYAPGSWVRVTPGTPAITGVVDIGGNLGINTTTPDYTLDVVGNARVSYGNWTGSDIKLKKNLRPVTDALSKVLQLAGVSYEWKTDIYNEQNSPEINQIGPFENKVLVLSDKNSKIPKGRHFGVIAQDVEKVLPEVVNTGADGIKAVAYNEIIPFLIEAIKEQQKRIDKLEKQISEN